MSAQVSYKASGVVLRRTKLGETDLIVTVLSDAPTQVRAIAKGARKPSAKLAGVVGLGSEVDFLLRRGRSLDIVTEGRLIASREAAARGLEREAMMEAILDTVADLTAEGEHDLRLLPLTTTALDAVVSCRDDLLALIGAAFVLKAASMQGYRPVLETCVACGEPLDLSALPTARLSFEDGGVVCDACADGLRGARRDSATLLWASRLISARFSDLLALPRDPGNARVGMTALELARQWIHHYPGVRPRALDFVFSLDYETLAQQACEKAR